MTMDEVAVPTTHRKFLSSPSLACDLSWVLHVAVRPEWSVQYPLIADFFVGREDLAERVRTFWARQPETCFTEMQVLAHHAGALGETSPPAFWKALVSAVATVPTDIGLESESPEDREIFLSRLEELKASPELVESYIALLREVWEPFDAAWQAALPRLEQSGRHVVAQLEAGRPLEELVGEACATFHSMLFNINERVESGQPLLVVPCMFFGKSLYLEFPGLTLVGSGFQQNDRGARERTEALARRLKTVADPTRLALLHFLASTPSTVGDLAVAFGLAQPTVSMHMKMLRETGLVRSVRNGGRLQLSADPEAVETLLSELRSAVV
jgi:DNA-binding transcriptional ArsR family regulator